MNPLLDQLLGGLPAAATIDNMKAFNAAQVSWVLSQIPLALTVSNSLTVAKWLSAHDQLTERQPVRHCQRHRYAPVLVNGAPAAWTAWHGSWTATALPSPGHQPRSGPIPGCQRVGARARTYADIWYDDGTRRRPWAARSPRTRTWTAAGGPYSVTSSLTVASGATLTIQPGTTVYLGSGVNLVVANGGRLLAEGTANAPIRSPSRPARRQLGRHDD